MLKRRQTKGKAKVYDVPDKSPNLAQSSNPDQPPHRFHYDVREVAQSFSSIATVVAGFAFAAVVLVVQNGSSAQGSQNQLNAGVITDWASIAFLIAFFGCILAAFVFTVVAGEQGLTARANTVAFIAGSGFSISLSLVYWGLVILLKTFLTPNVVTTVHQILPIIISLNPILLIFAVTDTITMFQERDPTKKEYIILLTLGYAPLVLAFLPSFINFTFEEAQAIFEYTIWFAFFIIILSNVLALIISGSKHEYRWRLWASGSWIFLHSIVLGLFLLLSSLFD